MPRGPGKHAFAFSFLCVVLVGWLTAAEPSRVEEIAVTTPAAGAAVPPAAAAADDVDDKALRNAGKKGEEWITHGINYAEQRFSPLTQIDATNVSRLGLAWSYDLGGGGGQQSATPLVVDGVIFGMTNWSIAFALDARSGRELWRFDPGVDRTLNTPGTDRLCCGVLNRG